LMWWEWRQCCQNLAIWQWQKVWSALDHGTVQCLSCKRFYYGNTSLNWHGRSFSPLKTIVLWLHSRKVPASFVMIYRMVVACTNLQNYKKCQKGGRKP
jgi:hypothetical protein